MKTTSMLLGAVAALLPLSLTQTAQAQCGGQGSVALQIVSVNNTGSVPGSQVTVRVSGPPNTHACFLCDTDDGPVALPGIGSFCLGFSPQLGAVVFQIPAAGFLEFTINLPAATFDLCCLGVTLDPTAPNGIGISNTVCLTVAEPCTGGGHTQLGYSTVFPGAGSGPFTVTATLGGQQGQPLAQTNVVFDPNDPPAFPITDDGVIHIEHIALVNGDLHVAVLNDSANLTGSNPSGRLPNDSKLAVDVDGQVNGAAIHTSCSQPLGVGMVFGPLTVTSLVQRVN